MFKEVERRVHLLGNDGKHNSSREVDELDRQKAEKLPASLKVDARYQTLLEPETEQRGLQAAGRTATASERKRTREELLQSEEKFRRLLAILPDVTWTATEDGRTTYISANVESVYGYTAEDLCERGEELWFGRIHKDDSDHVIDAYHALFAEGRPFEVEYQIQRKDSQWIWIHERALQIHEEDGVRYAAGAFSDITARKRAEQALTDSENSYRPRRIVKTKPAPGVKIEGNSS